MANEPTSSALRKECDSTLVAATRKGEARAFESLVSQYHTKIFTLAFRITRNREDAQDVAQQSFHKAFMHLDTFQEKSSFATWLTRIAINEALMYVRKRRYHHELSLEDFHSECKSPAIQIPDRGKSPAEILEENEKKRTLSKAIARLGADSRAVLLLQLEERSIKETAAILGIGIGTLKARLFRAREKLRVLLTSTSKLRPTAIAEISLLE